MIMLLRAVFAIALIAIATPSALAQGFRPLPTGQLDLERFGYYDRETIWPDPHISVCWESPSIDFANEKLIVQNAVKQSFEAPHSGLVLTGWAVCKTGDNGIHIRISDENPSSQVGHRKGGFLIKDPPTAMVLNFQFSKWPCYSGKEFCTIAIARHEFMHAVGVLHEHLRPDAPEPCKSKYREHDDYQGVDPHKILAYDPDSIMNYCNNIYDTHRSPDLSAIDFATIAILYPESR